MTGLTATMMTRLAFHRTGPYPFGLCPRKSYRSSLIRFRLFFTDNANVQPRRTVARTVPLHYPCETLNWKGHDPDQDHGSRATARQKIDDACADGYMMMTCRPPVTPINNNVLVSPEKRRDQFHGNLATLPKHPALQPRPPHAGNAHTLLRAHHVATKKKKTCPKNAVPVVPYVHAHPPWIAR